MTATAATAPAHHLGSHGRTYVAGRRVSQVIGDEADVDSSTSWSEPGDQPTNRARWSQKGKTALHAAVVVVRPGRRLGRRRLLHRQAAAVVRPRLWLWRQMHAVAAAAAMRARALGFGKDRNRRQHRPAVIPSPADLPRCDRWAFGLGHVQYSTTCHVTLTRSSTYVRA